MGRPASPRNAVVAEAIELQADIAETIPALLRAAEATGDPAMKTEAQALARFANATRLEARVMAGMAEPA